MIKILLVEDDKNIQRLLTLELRHKEYLVDSAYDGEQGMELFERNYYLKETIMMLFYLI